MKQALWCVMLGVGGFVVAWGGWHLYLDHQTFHAMISFINQQVTAAAAAQP